jgi:hypothetical protein
MSYGTHCSECTNSQHNNGRRYCTINDHPGVYLAPRDHPVKVFQILQRSIRNTLLMS